MIAALVVESTFRHRSPAERPWVAPATIAIVWNGRHWSWAQWTGAEWTAAPWTVRAVEVPSTALPASPKRAWQSVATHSIVGSRKRSADGIGGIWLAIGHVVASLLGLLLGYAILCALRPAEFSWQVFW